MGRRRPSYMDFFFYFIPYFQEFVITINKDIKGTVRQEQNLCLKLLEGACSAG